MRLLALSLMTEQALPSEADTPDERGVSVPSGPDEVSREWLSACLGLEGDDALRAVSVERIGGQYGLAGLVLRARMDPATPRASVVVKLWEITAASDHREAQVMRAFGSRLGARVPQCLHAGIDRAGGRGVLVMEDLHDVVQGDCLDLIETDHGVRLAESLAALHGRWWRSPELAETSWLPNAPSPSLGPEWLQARRGRFMERFGERLSEPFRRFLNVGVTGAYAAATDTLRAAPPTLLHQDVHLDNVLFDRSTGAPILLDWARAAAGPAVLDLCDLILSAAPRALDPMLAAYFGALAGHGVPEPDVRESERAITAAVVVSLVRSTFGIARWQPASRRESDIIETHIERAENAFAIWRIGET